MSAEHAQAPTLMIVGEGSFERSTCMVLKDKFACRHMISNQSEGYDTIQTA